MQDLPENHYQVSEASWVNIINYYYYYYYYIIIKAGNNINQKQNKNNCTQTKYVCM